jgi:uncharacterized protein YndB with AHSA1/START domain
MSNTHVTQHTRATRAAVYHTCLDARAVQQWMVPDDMTSEVHAFDPRVGGELRISLTYKATDARGKTAANTDTFHGRFVELVPDGRVVYTVVFETADPAMQGEMTVSIDLVDAIGGGTQIVYAHANLPPGVKPEDNEVGTRMSLAKLARLAERES